MDLNNPVYRLVSLINMFIKLISLHSTHLPNDHDNGIKIHLT